MLSKEDLNELELRNPGAIPQEDITALWNALNYPPGSAEDVWSRIEDVLKVVVELLSKSTQAAIYLTADADKGSAFAEVYGDQACELEIFRVQVKGDFFSFSFLDLESPAETFAFTREGVASVLPRLASDRDRLRTWVDTIKGWVQE